METYFARSSPVPPMVRRGAAGLLPVVSLVMLAFLSIPAESDADDPSADAVSVEVGNYYFSPSTVTIAKDDTVTWNWASGFHSVETSDGSDQWCSSRSSGSCSKTFPSPGTYAYRCGVHPSSMKATVVVEGEPATITIDAPTAGQEVEGTFVASGSASHTDGITAVAWRIGSAAYQPVDELTQDGTSATWATSIDTTGLLNGEHILSVRATAGDGGTTTETVSFTVVNAGTVDLQVSGLRATDGTTSTRLYVTLTNAGTLGQTGVDVLLTYEHHGTQREIGTVTLDVPAGKSFTRSLDWSADGKIGAFEIHALVDPDDLVTETDEDNNARTATAGFGTRLIPGIDPFEPI